MKTLTYIFTLLLLVATLNSQTRTTNFSVPLWNVGDVLRGGSKTDTSTANSGLNSVSLRFDKYLNLAAFKHLNNSITGNWTFSGRNIVNDYWTFSDSVLGNDILPNTSATYALGSLNRLWNQVHARDVRLGEASVIGGFVLFWNEYNSYYGALAPARSTMPGTWNGASTNVSYYLPYTAAVTTSPIIATINGGQTFTSSIWNGTAIGTAYGGLGGSTTPTSGKILTGNGSAWLATTAGYPETAGTDNNFLRSNGADIISEAVSKPEYKSGSFQNLSGITTAPDSFIVFIPTITGYTVDSIFAIRIGGTAASINVSKNGSTILLASNYATTTSIASAGAVQNGTLTSNDILRIRLVSVSGSPTEIYITLKLLRNL